MIKELNFSYWSAFDTFVNSLIFRNKMSVDYPGYAYGSLVALGGIMGYLKRKSIPSLVAGVTCGSFALYGAYSVPDFSLVLFAFVLSKHNSLN